jgi:hypothetical protein
VDAEPNGLVVLPGLEDRVAEHADVRSIEERETVEVAFAVSLVGV